MKLTKMTISELVDVLNNLRAEKGMERVTIAGTSKQAVILMISKVRNGF